MDEGTRRDVEELGGMMMAHMALITSMMGVLQNRGLIKQADVNEMIDLALVGVENAHPAPKVVRDHARQTLESMAHTMGGKLRR